jgi:hypothetical protein
MNMQLRILGILAFLLTGSENAYAYIDPGTGSMLLQGLIAAVAAAAIAIKLYWQKVKAFLFGRGEKARSPTDDGREGPEEDDSR